MAVDVGSYGAAYDTVEYIRKYLKWDVRDLCYIAATHFHIDHIGGIGHLFRMYGAEIKVLFNHRVKDYISGRKKILLVRNWLTGLMPASLVSVRYVRRLSHLIFMNCTGIPLPGIRNIVKLSFDNDRISYFGSGNKGRYKLGFETWEVIYAPGHTDDSVSFFNETTELPSTTSRGVQRSRRINSTSVQPLDRTIVMACPFGTSPNFSSPEGEGFQPSPKGTLKNSSVGI